MALTEGQHALEFLISEANGSRSRAQIVLEAAAAAGGARTLKAGQVLGLKRGAVAAPVAFTAETTGRNNSGNGTFAATPTALAGAKAGRYKLVIIEPATDAGQFQLEDPDGNIIGTGAVAAAFAGPHLSFTLQDGSNNFASGDGFFIDVAIGTKYVALLEAGTDGSEIPAAICGDNYSVPEEVDTKAVAFVRDCEVHGDEIVWPATYNSGDKAAAIAVLAQHGIIVRTLTA